MSKKTWIAWGVRLGSVALTTAVLGTIGSQAASTNPNQVQTSQRFAQQQPDGAQSGLNDQNGTFNDDSRFSSQSPFITTPRSGASGRSGRHSRTRAS